MRTQTFRPLLVNGRPIMSCMLAVVAFVALMIAVPGAEAQAGTLIKNVNLPVTGFGVSVAVDCLGNVYYTLAGNTNLFQMDKDGVLLGTTPITDSVSGLGLVIDEMAWDETRRVLWGVLHGSNPEKVYMIDAGTGVATFAFDSQTISAGTFRDGIAFDGADDSLWIKGDVSTTVEHYKAADGSFINQITPKNATGAPLGFLSGVTVGAGDLLYLGRDGFAQIVQVTKSGDFIGLFASPGGARDEGLECDSVNFAPKLALWSREFNAPGFMSVIEVEPGTCACGGGGIDPIIIRERGEPVSQTHTGVPQAWSKITILNGDPGLTNLRITANGKLFEVAGLRNNEVRTINVVSAMAPGNNNTIELTGYGKPGGRASVLVH